MSSLPVDVLRQVFEALAEEGGLASLSACTTVNQQWFHVASEYLWKDVSPAVAHLSGYHLPRLIETLGARPYLARHIKVLEIKTVLDAALWNSNYENEGDAFADLVMACPQLRRITAANFEVASRDHIIRALSTLEHLQEFHIRVYLESSRRSTEFSQVIRYFDYDTDLVSRFMKNWPNLKAFTVTHCPETAYHMRPDWVLAPASFPLLPHSNKLRELHLRETMIDDQGLLHLIGRNQIRSFSLMSCQGITSSAVTKTGLVKALYQCGAHLEELTLMTPWLHINQPSYIMDQTIASCPNLTDLTLMGCDVSDAFFQNLHSSVRLRSLGISDFEHITPQGLFEGLRLPQLSKVEMLAVWQRNGGINGLGQRITSGWFHSIFTAHATQIQDLAKRGVALATDWESRLLAGGSPVYIPLDALRSREFKNLDLAFRLA